ncbi:ATP-dependent helicase HepA [bacterium BMS3Bbin09]|nr:ATP-dependent helicase HepA [bacterium BMS3Bbin09]HDH34467.1 NgoFVII family restriction endonuclease [Nitrospirota bacterium]
MPRIFDNIEAKLLSALQETINVSERADFCVGYFNLRGWKKLDSYIEKWPGGEGKCCRLLVGMQKMPQDELHEAFSLIRSDTKIDNQTAVRIKKKLAEEFRHQLTIGIPTNEDEAGLRRLAKQIKAKKVVVKLFLKHQLHAKLYLLFRPDPINPTIGYLGSSNLTFSGLSYQGELNIDVLEHDACNKLAEWFEDRWNDRWCLDISKELVQIIEESWAGEELIPPYHIYIKMAYHLAEEARSGLLEFNIPKDFGNKLFEFQTAAVKIAAHHLNKRGGVLIGDVVGLGKTLMATALARIFEDDHDMQTLILCPKNLVKMWEDYVYKYRMRAKVLSVTRAQKELPDLRRYRLVILDESHNLRNRKGKRYRVIRDYIQENDCKCILLSATPYNKNYLDLSNQLRLFLEDDKDIGVRPERKIREMGEIEFQKLQISPRSLSAFEKSEYPDDWRDLMRLYLVRRTRSFIQDNYSKTDPETGRKFLTFEDGSRSYFPVRVPKNVTFHIDDSNPDDQYARLYSTEIVEIINSLSLPRYGLANYIHEIPHEPPTQTEAAILQDLSRAGKRLMGFCRTNLFKRLESSGNAFILSLERLVLRNYIFLYAIENGKPLPIGTQDPAMMDARFNDEDTFFSFPDDEDNTEDDLSDNDMDSEKELIKRASELYRIYETKYKKRFRWLKSSLFLKDLAKDLKKDIIALISALEKCGEWDADKDAKLDALHDLISKRHPEDKIIVFSQFADTVRYLESKLKDRGISALAGVSGDADDPTGFAWRFSPVSNEKETADELRVLIATDVLSEGQNLQDCAIVVNYDLPWAIIRLIQRAGRVDRIGQQAERIICYSFLPAEGVERIINLRARVRMRLQENAEVVGTDESFFEDDNNDQLIIDLYHEKATIMDGDADGEVDLASYAYQIWKNAITQNPELEKKIPALQPVIYSTRSHEGAESSPEGVLVYMRTGDGNDALTWINREGESVTESQFEILKTAKCEPDEPAIERYEKHHELVLKGVERIMEEEKLIGGQLGRPSGARFRTYERLKKYLEDVGDHRSLFVTEEFINAVEKANTDIYKRTLRQIAVDALNRQLRTGASDEELARLAVALNEDGRLCVVLEEEQINEPHIICSLGLFKTN